MKCIVISNNQNKIKEIAIIFKSIKLTVIPVTEHIGHNLTVIENGLTFEENSKKKCKAINDKKNIILADDSGLEVTALNGKPGIFSARFGGPQLTDKERCLYLLDQLGSQKNRDARLLCCIAIKINTLPIQIITGILHGHIAKNYSGQKGFGYDPIFIPNQYTETLATLGPKIKNKISHRKKALSQALHIIQSVYPDLKKNNV